MQTDVSPAKGVVFQDDILSRYRTAIMGIAALLIFFYHDGFFTMTIVVGKIDAVTFLQKNMSFGVDIFLFLSGIGLVCSMQRNSVRDFYINRVLRVFLPFLLVMAATALIHGWSFLNFLRHVSGYTFFFTDISSVQWFVPAILTIYLFFPIYFYLMAASGSKRVFTVFSLAVLFILLFLFGSNIREDLYTFLYRIPVFLMGCLYGFEAKKPLSWEKLITLIAINIIGLYRIYLYFYPPYSISKYSGFFLIGISFPFIFAKLLELIDRYKIGKSFIKILGFYGSMSLEFYCVQEAICRETNNLLEEQLSVPWIHLISLILSTLAGYLLFLTVKFISSKIRGAIKKTERRTIRAQKKGLIVGIVGYALLFILVLVTYRDVKNYFSGRVYNIDGQYITDNINLPAGDYGIKVKYDADADTELEFYPYGNEGGYPVLLQANSGKLDFPLHLDRDSDTIHFAYKAASEDDFSIKKIYVMESTRPRINNLFSVLFFVATAYILFFVPSLRKFKEVLTHETQRG